MFRIFVVVRCLWLSHFISSSHAGKVWAPLNDNNHYKESTREVSLALTCAWKMERDLAVCSGMRTRTRNCLCSDFKGSANPFMMLRKTRVMKFDVILYIFRKGTVISPQRKQTCESYENCKKLLVDDCFFPVYLNLRLIMKLTFEA